LRITKLQAKNFGPYRGTIELNFSGDKNKTLWIVWGNNGAGKTHVYKAIKWCLYGWDPSPGDKIRPATNRDAWDLLYGTNLDQIVPPDPYMSVYLWLEHEEEGSKHQYLITRRVTPVVANPRTPAQIDVQLEVKIDGVKKENPREAIEAILPVAASQFFMFHGEEIRKMSLRHGEDVKDAIELILEAQTFRQGRDHLVKISRQIERDVDEERATVGELGNYLSIKKQINEKIDSYKQEIDGIQKEISSRKERLDEVDRRLRSQEASQILMGQLDEKRQQLNQAEEDRTSLIARESDLVAELPAKLILSDLKQVLAKKEQRHKRIEQQLEQIAELRGARSLAEKIAGMERCICGTKITSVEKAHLKGELGFYAEKLKELQSKLETEDPTYYEVRDTVTAISNSRLDFEEYKRDRDRLDLRIDELRSSIKGIEKDLAESDMSAVRDLQRERTGLIQEIARKEERLGSLNDKLEEQAVFLNKVEKNLKRVDIHTNVKKSLERQLEIASAAGSAFEDVLLELTEVKREVIEREATSIFRKLTNKPDEYDAIVVDENYDVAVMNKDKKLLEREKLSTGEREIVALSFILGLMHASEKDAPLVLDTFFTHLDDAHYTNIVTSLPDFAKQVILILTNVEYQNLRERASENFLQRVAGSWHAVRDQGRKESHLESEGELVPIQVAKVH